MPRLSGGAVVCFVLHVARLVTPTHTWAAIVSADSAVMNLTTSEVTSHLEHTWPDRRPGPDTQILCPLPIKNMLRRLLPVSDG